MMKCPWNDSFHGFVLWITHHCEGFPASCLTICKDSSIVSFEDTFDKWKCTLFIYRCLTRFLCKYTIKSKYFCSLWVISWKNWIQCNRSVCLVNWQTAFTLIFFFFWVHRTNSDHNFHTFSTHTSLQIGISNLLVLFFSFISLEFLFFAFVFCNEFFVIFLCLCLFYIKRTLTLSLLLLYFLPVSILDYDFDYPHIKTQCYSHFISFSP